MLLNLKGATIRPYSPYREAHPLYPLNGGTVGGFCGFGPCSPHPAHTLLDVTRDITTIDRPYQPFGTPMPIFTPIISSEQPPFIGTVSVLGDLTRDISTFMDLAKNRVVQKVNVNTAPAAPSINVNASPVINVY